MSEEMSFNEQIDELLEECGLEPSDEVEDCGKMAAGLQD